MKPISRTRFDSLIEALSRGAAQRTSRRGFLSQCGLWLIAASALPLLPVARRAQADRQTDAARCAGNEQGFPLQRQRLHAPLPPLRFKP